MSAPRKDDGLDGCGLALLVTPASMAYGAVVSGFAFSTLWRWFVVPALDVRPIGIAHAAGLLLVVSLCGIGDRVLRGEADADTLRESLNKLPVRHAKATSLTGAVLLIGYVIQRWFL